MTESNKPEKKTMREDLTGKELVQFLRENEMSFVVPGSYSIPWYIVGEAIDEFLLFGSSSLLQKHKDWTHGCWDINSLKKGDYRNQYCTKEFTEGELRKLLEMKFFWDDDTDIEFLDDLLRETLELEERRSTYSFKRKQGFTQSLKNQCLKRDGNKCVLCGCNHDLEVDHMVELVDGGENDIDNLQTLCKWCHRMKSDSSRKARHSKESLTPSV